MDKIEILCAKDREMMHEFSRRSLHAVDRSLLSRTLSFFSSYLDGNVRKEVDKDRLIIREAAAAFEAAGRYATWTSKISSRKQKRSTRLSSTG